MYIDRLFLLQLVQSCVIPAADKSILRRHCHAQTDCFLASAAGTLLFCVIFLLPGISRNIKVLLFALCSLATLWLAFRIRTLQVFCRAVILYHAAAFLLAGALYALHAAGRRPAMTTMQASCAVGIGTAALYILRWEKECAGSDSNRNTGRWRRKITLEALIDSGNSLYDPISQKAGMRCGKSGAGRENPWISPKNSASSPTTPWQKHGIMQAVEIEKLKVKKEGQELVIEKALLGLYENKVTQSGAYQMILHPALLENRRNGHDIKSCNTRKNAV